MKIRILAFIMLIIMVFTTVPPMTVMAEDTTDSAVVEITELTLSETSLNLASGQTTQLSVTNVSDVEIVWSSSNESIATVDENGNVKAIAAGTATISATYEDLVANCEVTVKNKKLPTTEPSISRNASGIKVSWAKVDGASKYEVWRKVGTYYSKVKTTSSLSYTDTNIAYNKTYSYKIKAIGTSDGLEIKSAFSPVVSNTVKSIYKPVTVSAKSVGYKSIKISWSRVYPATGYEVYRATSSNGTYKKIVTITSGSTLSYKDTGLTTGKTYYYKIKAKASTKSSVYSTKVSAKPVLIAPQLKTSAAASSSTITVKWNKLGGANGYYVYRRTSTSNSWTKIATITNANTLSYKDTGRSGKYYYAVKGYKTVDGKRVAGALSASVRLSTLTAPSITVTQYDNQFKDRVKWNAVTNATAYQVYRKRGSNGEWEKVATTTSTSYTCSVTHGINYSWKIRPVYQSNGTTTFGPFSKVKDLVISYEPECIISMSTETVSKAYGVAMSIENTGKGNMRIYSTEAGYADVENEKYNRDMYLVNAQTGKKISYIDIKPGETKTVVFMVADDDYTKYTAEGFVAYKFRYDGSYYYGVSSAYYGSWYDYYV